MRKSILISLVVLSLCWWVWVGFRVVAYNSGQFGSVTLQWSHFQEPHQLLTLDPTPDDAVAIVESGATTHVFLKPVFHFRQVQIRLQADSQLVVSPVLQSGLAQPALQRTAPISFADLALRHGVYEFDISNQGTKVAHLRSIDITLQP